MATTPVSKTIDQIEALANPTRNAKVVIGSGNKIYVNLLSTLLALVTKADVGIENVDNTSDAEKPVSTAQAQALAGKASNEALQALSEQLVLKASQEDLDALAQAATQFVTITQLGQALEGVAPINHTHSLEDIENLIDALNSKAEATHTHPQNSIQNLVADLNAIRTSILGKAPTLHGHNATEIAGLEEMIIELIGDLPSLGSVTSGTNQW